jgi:nucleoside-diphosphate-sugar epimerase
VSNPDADVESIVFASAIYVVGIYDRENTPEIYAPDSGFVVDRTAPIRPDSFYGVSKAFGVVLGRFYVENFGYPK